MLRRPDSIPGAGWCTEFLTLASALLRRPEPQSSKFTSCLWLALELGQG